MILQKSIYICKILIYIFAKLYYTMLVIFVQMWRNWQTRKFQVLVGQPVKSSSLFICTKGVGKGQSFFKNILVGLCVPQPINFACHQLDFVKWLIKQSAFLKKLC